MDWRLSDGSNGETQTALIHHHMSAPDNVRRLQSPVALFLFNRPETTRKVFEVIRRAQPSMMLVVADGPRPHQKDDASLCAATRAVIDGVDWDCEVKKYYADTNMGCGRRVSSGLSW